MSFFTDAKIGTRIAAAMVAPIVGLLLFSGLSLWDRHVEVRNLEKVGMLAELAPTISALVHEMQKERGASAGFISSKGAKFADALPAQRKDTDAKRTALNAALDAFPSVDYSATFRGKIDAARTSLAELDAKRKAIDGFELTVAQMASYYTPTIRKFLSAIEEMSVLSTDALVTQRIGAYTSFLQAKERAGVERAMGAGGFGAGKFAPAIYNNFVGLIAQQQAFMGQFNVYATQEEKAFAKKTLSGNIVDEVERMRAIAIASPQSGDLGGIDGPTWFSAITAKINLMKAVEDHLAEDLGETAAHDRDTANTAFSISLIVTLVLIGITGVLVVTIVRGITRPLDGMTDAMTALAGGNKEIEIPGVGRGDEIGGMAEAVQVFKANMIKADEMAERERAEVEQREQRTLRMESLTQEFDQGITEMLSSMTGAATEMESTATSMSGIADDTSQRATAVAAASEEASSNVQTVATATEELSASIQEISRQVSQSSDIAGRAVEQADRTNSQVQGLAAAANKIGEVVSLISDIAEQTNLLALNATIEAARAGDAGKGFAVVASEVKNLANQTAKATEDISQQIGGIQEETQDAVTAIGSIGSTINDINEIASAIAAAVEEQGAATGEIARNVEQAAIGTQDVSSNIVEVTRAAGETGSAASQVTEVARDLNQRADGLRAQVEKFLADVRSV